MISFKTKEDLLPSVLIILSSVAIIGILVFSLLFPVHSPAAIRQQATTDQNQIIDKIEHDKKDADSARAAIGPRLWKGDENHVGASVLALVTSFTAKNGVKLTAFRPQRTANLGGVLELPYTLQLAGPYPGIRAVMQSLDRTDNKVVLRSVQLSASEEVTGAVTSTLGISAYITVDPEIAANIGSGGGQNAKVH
jgi:hypothetical protein